jgi:hypothetical protein
VRVATTKLGDEVTRFARAYTDPPDLTPIGASFDLAVAVAIVLEAGRMTGDESQPAWLDAHAAALREWYGKITIEHDPALTARVIDGARAIPAGRRAIAALGPRDWLHLVRRYRAHYGSTLLRTEEALGWLKVATRTPPRKDPGLPLYFPNRVTIERVDGTTETLQLDLPAGSIAGDSIDRVLRAKWQREVGPRLGAARAEAALATALRLEHHELGAFVASVTS